MFQLTQVDIPAGKVGIHWFEQSSYAVKDAAGMLLLVDPYFPTQRPANRFVHTQPPAYGEELPANIVLLTHSHGDHTDPESIGQIQRAHADVIYVGPQDALDKIIAQAGVSATQTRVMQAGESITVHGVTIHAVYAKPPNGDPKAGIAPPDVPHLGYVVEMGGQRLYFSGDPIHTFADLPELINPVAALKPQIGFLTNHPNEGEFPFFDGSARMAQHIGLKVAVPAHYECFVKRNYDPQEWAKHLPANGPKPLIIPHNSHIVWGS